LGYTGAKTGIDLGLLLRGLNKLPILFLSRTDENNIDVYRGLGTIIEPRTWLHKGFSGEQILKDTYIADTVVPEIENLLLNHQHGEKAREVNFLVSAGIVQQKLKTLFRAEYEQITKFRPSEHTMEELDGFTAPGKRVLTATATTEDYHEIGSYILKLSKNKST